MTDERGDHLRAEVNRRDLWNEPLFCDMLESYFCVKKHQGHFEVIHDRKGIRVRSKWMGKEVIRKLMETV